jgi:transcriptional regulator with XRE-family HTH domain
MNCCVEHNNYTTLHLNQHFIAFMLSQTFGSRLRERRRLLKIRQEDLAELSGVGLRTVIAVENGTANPSLETITKLTQVLGLELTLNVKA